MARKTKKQAGMDISLGAMIEEDIASHGKPGDRPVLMALTWERPEMLKKALEAGANPNGAGNDVFRDEWPPFRVACMEASDRPEFLECVSIMLEAGVKAGQRDADAARANGAEKTAAMIEAHLAREQAKMMDRSAAIKPGKASGEKGGPI